MSATYTKGQPSRLPLSPPNFSVYFKFFCVILHLLHVHRPVSRVVLPQPPKQSQVPLKKFLVCFGSLAPACALSSFFFSLSTRAKYILTSSISALRAFSNFTSPSFGLASYHGCFLRAHLRLSMAFCTSSLALWSSLSYFMIILSNSALKAAPASVSLKAFPLLSSS